MLPFPLRVAFAIALASCSIWNIRPLNFSTDQRPFASTSRSNSPAVAVPVAPGLAVVWIVRTTSRLISAKISDCRMFANSDSASRPCTARRSCANSVVYSAFSARDFADTVTFSIENAISAIVVPSPRSSAVPVSIPVPVVITLTLAFGSVFA